MNKFTLCIYLNNNCNFNCYFCTVDKNQKPKSINKIDLETFLENNKDVLDLSSVRILGGEPTLILDQEYMDIFNKYYENITVITNLTQNLDKLLNDNPKLKLIVSYSGKTDDLFKTNGDILKNIVKYKERILNINYMLNKLTLDEVLETMDFMKQYNIPIQYNPQVVYKEFDNKFEMDFDNIKSIFKKLYKENKDLVPNFDFIINYKDFCNCMYKTFTINPDGNIFPCASFAGVYNTDNEFITNKYNLGYCTDVLLKDIKLNFDCLKDDLISWDGEKCFECKKCPGLCKLYNIYTNGQGIDKNKCLFYRALNEIVDEDNTLNPSTVTIILTEECNLACKYCFEQKSKKLKGLMSTEVIQKSIDILFNSNTKDKKSLDLFGGEPSLNKKGLKFIIQYFKEKNIKDISVHITTNMYYLDEELINIYKELNEITNFTLTVSMDGNKESHNISRITIDGKPTYNKVISNSLRLRKSIPNLYMSQHCVISKQTIKYIESIVNTMLENVKTIFNEISIAPVTADTKTDEFDFEELEYFYKMLKKLKEKNICEHIYNNLFANFIIDPFILIHEKGLTYCGAGEDMIAIRSNGDIIPCHRYIDSDGDKTNLYVLKNILDYKENKIIIPRTGKWQEYQHKSEKIKNNEYKVVSELGYNCNECPFSHACHMCVAGSEITSGSMLINSKEKCIRTMKMAELAAKYKELEMKDIINKNIEEFNNNLEFLINGQMITADVVKNLTDRVAELENIVNGNSK